MKLGIWLNKNDGSSVQIQYSYDPKSGVFPGEEVFDGTGTNPGSLTAWAEESDGSGTTYAVGDAIPQAHMGAVYYAIWEVPDPVPYLVTDTELKSIADAIRAKGDTSSQLTFPQGFVDAIDAIPSGGGNIDPFINRSISAISNSTVTTIGSYAFAGCTFLETVSFPAATSIGFGAFSSCRKLTEVNCPSVTTISTYAFTGCNSMRSAIFPAAKRIDMYAFGACYALSEISFPAASFIGSSAFSYCSKLTTVYFPSVSSAGTNTFAYCTSLTTANFPALKSIGDGAFSQCTSLTTISFPIATIIGKHAFASCKNLSTVSFPAVLRASMGAFQSCYSLTTVSLPAITSINAICFMRCYHLLSLYLLGSSYCTLENIAVFSSTPISTYTTSTGGIHGSIFVRASMYSSYITRTNWATYSARFVSLTDAQIAALDT